MTCARPDPLDDADTIPRLPGWVTSGRLGGQAGGRAEPPEDVAFLSGAALGHLHLVLTRDAVPGALLRERLALRAAAACVTLAGRPERAAELRDALCLLRPGDRPGPAGQIYRGWRRAAERPVSVPALHRALPDHAPERIAAWLDGGEPRGAGQGAPVAQAARVLAAVLAATRDEAAALLLADAALARALGWDHLVPLLAAGMTRRDLRAPEEALRLACHRALVASVAETLRMAADLTRRAARLRAVAPKLRARGAAAAVQMVLTRDAVAAAALPLPDRAARRLCDRLVSLGALRELTGRDTFRLYGL